MGRLKEQHCDECDVTFEGIWCPECGVAPDPEYAKEVLGSVKGGAFGKNSNSPQIEAFWNGADASEVFGKGKSDQPPMFK